MRFFQEPQASACLGSLGTVVSFHGFSERHSIRVASYTTCIWYEAPLWLSNIYVYTRDPFVAWLQCNYNKNSPGSGGRSPTIWHEVICCPRANFACRHYAFISWWRHQMEIFSALLALCVGNSPVTGEFPAQRSVTRSFDVFCDLRLNKRLSKQSWGWWLETPSRSLWRHCNIRCMIELCEINMHGVGIMPETDRNDQCIESDNFWHILTFQDILWHDANSVVTGGTGVCLHDNRQCHQWRQSWHHGDFFNEHIHVWCISKNIGLCTRVCFTLDTSCRDLFTHVPKHWFTGVEACHDANKGILKDMGKLNGT